jgi:class 3 adenylate cyclase
VPFDGALAHCHYHLPHVSDDARIDTGATAERGFLFSDMRGFTAYAEQHGNTAAAAMVARFLEIARTAIARYEGAEIKTEGDAIHAVFPSAASAVLCGLEIVDAAAQENAQEPDQPLGLGVGVHAGEAVETAEGYIGTAVNLAARLCSIAQPGEVLVSSTVKGITQADLPVGFIARGRQRLKGIREPVEVFAVTRDTTARTAVVLPRLGMLLGISGFAGVGVVAILAIAALLPASPLIGPPSPQPVILGPLQIGTYSSVAFRPPVVVDIADPGWSASRDLPDLFGLVREEVPRGSLYLARVQEVFRDPCVGGSDGATGPAAGDVIGELEALGHLEVSNAKPVQVGGFSGQQVDVTVSEGVLAACGGLVGQEVALFGIGDEVWRASPAERFRLVSVNVVDEAVTILLSSDWTASQSVQELEDLLALGELVLGTVEFSAPPTS